MRARPIVLVLLVIAWLTTGCTAAPEAERRPEPSASVSASTPASTPTSVPTSGPPRLAHVTGHVLHRRDGSRLTIRLGLRGRWGITSLVPVRDGYLVTDDRWFEGSVGMHRVDADGQVVDSWASTGPAETAPDGGVAWVSMVAPESGESGPTELHTETGAQRLKPLIWPVISSYDGRVVTFTALRREGKDWNRRGFSTDLEQPPYRVPTPSGRTRSPDGRHWWQLRRRTLVVGGTDGEVEIPARPFLQTFARPIWEDDSHLLVTLVHRRRMAIGRIDLDGTVTRAGDWSPFDVSGFAFVARRVSG